MTAPAISPMLAALGQPPCRFTDFTVEAKYDVIDILDVGLRSGYVATVHAAPLMLPQRHGREVFTDLMDKTGQAWIGTELAVGYGIKDAGGRQPPSYRDLHGIHPIRQFSRVSR